MKKALILVLALALSLSLFAGCGKTEAPAAAEPTQAPAAQPEAPAEEKPAAEQPQTPAEKPAEPVSEVKTGGDLTILVKKSPTAFGYPPKCSGGDRDVVAPIFDRLIAIDDNGEYQPELASSWEYSADFLTLTLHLRDDVKFHDGTDFNAEAVKFNLDALIPPQSTVLTGVDSVEVVDDYTVQMNLSAYNNLIIYQLASAYECYIYSPTALENDGVDFMKTHPVGTGAFKFDGYEPDSYVKLVKNEDYWRCEPNLDTITFEVCSEGTTQRLSFEAGETDGIFDASVNVTAALRDLGANVKIAPGAIYSLCFDSSTNPALADVRVRMAIEYAIDKEAICEGPGYGLYIPTYQVLPTDSVGYNPDCEPRKYDPEKAKALLAEAGYADGLTLDMFVLETYWKDGPVAVQSCLAEVGITLNLNYGNQAAYNNIRVAGNIDTGTISQQTMNIFANPLYTLDFYWKASPDYFNFVQTPAICDELIQKAKQATTADEVNDYCKQICKAVYDDCTVIPLWVNPRMAVLTSAVKEDGYFVGGDSNNVVLGNYTWLDK